MIVQRAQIPAVLWTFVIASSCLAPAFSFSQFSFDQFIGIDKVLHLTLYFGFFILWFLSSDNRNIIPKKRNLLLVSILFGVLIEVLQKHMGLGRSYDIADIAANIVGSLIGWFSAQFVKDKLPLIKKYLPFVSKLYR